MMKLFNTSKKAQITIFMIMGIIILFAIGMFFFVKSKVTAEKPALIPTLDKIPADGQKFRDYVNACIGDILDEAVNKISYQGGNLYSLDRDIQGDLDPLNPTVFKQTGSPISYWYYTDSNNQDIYHIPFLNGDNSNTIESQIEMYVSSHLRTCENNFVEFRNTGYQIDYTLAAPKVTAYINDKGASAVVYDPIEVTSKGSSDKLMIEKFKGDYNSNLKNVYSLAKEIVLYEATTRFLEEFMINGLGEYTSTDPGKGIPPMYYSSEFTSCIPHIWPVNKIKETVETVADKTIPFLRIANTNYPDVVISPDGKDGNLQDKMQDAFDNFVIYEAGKNQYPNLHVQFTPYPLTSFDINGDSFGAVSATRVDGPLPSVALPIPGFSSSCLMDYSFYYSFKFPVLVTIVDDTPGKELFFQFPMDLAVINNKERQPLSLSVKPLTNPNQQLFNLDECSSEFMTSDYITIKVTDNITGKGIPYADVKYQCTLLGDLCFMGSTDKSGILKTRFRECNNGAMTVTHNDYLGNVTSLSIQASVQNQYNFSLKPYKKVNVTVFSLPMEVLHNDTVHMDESTLKSILKSKGLSASDLPYCELSGGAAIPLTNGLAVGSLSKLNYKTGMHQFTQLMWDSDRVENTFPIAPGVYNLSSLLYYNRPYTIPKDSSVIEYQDENGDDQRIAYPEEDIVLSLTPLGGVENTFEISEDQYNRITNDTVLNLYMINFNNPANVEELGSIFDDYKACSDKFSSLLKPKLTALE